MQNFISVRQISERWNLSERSVRNYCATNRISGVIFKNGSWFIPFNAVKPTRKNEMKNKNEILTRLRREKKLKYKNGLYHILQIKFTYNSNHIEGSKLSEEETEYIFSTRTIETIRKSNLKVDDILETINHFRCIDRVIDFANYELSEHFIKELHQILKNNTYDSSMPIYNVGDYKILPNVVGTSFTCDVKNVAKEMNKLITNYNKKKYHSFEEIAEFHVRFERIHPFSDGNGRVGRLILLKECLKNNIVPILIDEDIKTYYYRGIKLYDEEKGYLLDTLRCGQDKVLKILDYFKIPIKR